MDSPFIERVFTTRQKLLFAALDLDAPFTLDELVDRAAARDPRTFVPHPRSALRGRVVTHVEVMLRTRLLTEGADERMAVTKVGREFADMLLGQDRVAAARIAAMPRALTVAPTLAPDAPASDSDRRVVASLARCAALRSLERGRPVSLAEALDLWGLLPGRVEGARVRLDALTALLVRVGHDPDEALSRAAWKLHALHLSLVPRFAGEIGGA